MSINVVDASSFRKSVKSLADRIADDGLNDKIAEINEATDEKKKYEVKDGNYHIPTKR